MAINYPLSSTQCQNGTGFMPWYKLSRTDCATVTHLYIPRPNTSQRQVLRTIRNIVREHALVHHIEYTTYSTTVCARRTALWGDYAGTLQYDIMLKTFGGHSG